MTDHCKVRGHGLTQLGSMTNIAGVWAGSTVGYDLCHDLPSSEETEVTFLTEIMGGGNSLTSYSHADPGTRPNTLP